MVLPPCIDQQLISIYVRLEQLQWSLLTQQRRVGRLMEQQRKKMEEQEKLIAFLTHKLAAREQVLGVSQVEELEKSAMSRLPKLVEESEPVERKQWEGDGDSAIHLNSTFDSINSSSSSSSVERPLQRSVSDVVGRKRNEKEASESFPSNLYRGFLLRHQKKQRGMSLGPAPSSTSLPLTIPAVEKVETEMYRRSVKKAHKTTILINSGPSRKNCEDN